VHRSGSSVALAYDEVASPIGTILLAGEGDHLAALDFDGYQTRFHQLLARRFGTYVLTKTRNPARLSDFVRAYFDGNLRAFDATLLSMRGTPFQERAWQALRNIRPGTVATYAEQARKLDVPNAVRAIGHANGQNPIVIAIPCHRVIASSGALTGYAGGLDRKRWLLRHEGVAI
jgi:methylated-DNA-[protein]-cysteine S-methyltransferase